MNKQILNILDEVMLLEEYQRKQIISILIASMLNDYSNNEARQIYNNIINQLNN